MDHGLAVEACNPEAGPGQFEIVGQLYAADGSPIDGEFKISGSVGNRGEARVAALSTGGFVVIAGDLFDFMSVVVPSTPAA